MTVYKYQLTIDDKQEILMPEGAKILSFENQHEIPVIWAFIDPVVVKTAREFRMVGTGYLITEDNLRFIGTALFRGGVLVFHLFEVIPSERKVEDA